MGAVEEMVCGCCREGIVISIIIISTSNVYTNIIEMVAIILGLIFPLYL